MSSTQFTPAQKEIDLLNVGPIEHLNIKLSPGINVLKGPNGSGKSNALKAISRLAGGEHKVPIRDGSKSAQVDGLGIKLVIGRTTKSLGEIVVRSLEGVADIGELVDPGIEDPLRADQRRLNALLRMARVVPIKEMFSALLNGSMEQFDHVVLSTDITSDIVETQAKVKRRFEERARAYEQDELKAQATIDANSKDLVDVDLSLADQAEMLRALHEAAIADRAALISKEESAKKVIAEADAAQRLMDTRERFDETSEQIAARATTLRSDIMKAEAALVLMKNQMKAAEELYRSVKAHETSTAQWQASITAAKGVERPTPADLAAASKAAEDAKNQYEAALTAARLSKKAAEIEEQKARLNEANEQATLFREAAKKTEQVLADALNLKDVRIVAGRLVLNTDRGEENLSELSDGERWTWAIDTVAGFLGNDGLMLIPQNAFEGLDNSHRKLVAKRIEELGVYAITAEADMSDLHVEQFKAEMEF